MPVGEYLRQGFQSLRWPLIVLYGVGAGLLMPLSLLQSTLAIVAGVIPVGIGLLIARTVKGFYGLYGFLTGLVGALTSVVLLWILIFVTGNSSLVANLDPTSVSPMNTFLTASGFISFSLIAFCTFGATTSGRMEERNRELRAQTAARGGTLERAGAVREVGDIRGFTLAQLGWYVNNLFKKKGFKFRDYKFVDKDRFVDLWYEYEEKEWHVRCAISDKVTPGTIESLVQEMKRENITKGIVVASTEFTPAAIKSVKDKPVVLIDGLTLYDISK
jgi:hypothetical protein